MEEFAETEAACATGEMTENECMVFFDDIASMSGDGSVVAADRRLRRLTGYVTCYSVTMALVFTLPEPK